MDNDNKNIFLEKINAQALIVIAYHTHFNLPDLSARNHSGFR